MQPTPLEIETLFDGCDLDRRAWPRFERRIRVLFLPEDCALDEPYSGWIVNASRGGVRLLVRTAGLAEDTLLNLRLPTAPRHVACVPVRVMNRTFHEGHWELGCAFLRPVLHETAVLFR